MNKNVSFQYADGLLNSAEISYSSGTNLTTNYSYSDVEYSGESYFQIFTNLLGSQNNAILFDGIAPVENNTAIFYHSRLVTEIDNQGDAPKNDRYEHTFDNQGYPLTTRLYINGIIRFKMTYVYEYRR